MGCPHMYSTGPRTSIACLSAVFLDVEFVTEGRDKVPMMGEGVQESRDLLRCLPFGKEMSTSEPVVLPGRLLAAFSSSHTLDGDHFTKSLSLLMLSIYMHVHIYI